jgi:beta-N-acetylhexosaminidase
MNKNYDRRDHIKPVILGVEGLELKDKEFELFNKHNPLGFILFSRNIETPKQVKKLVSQMKSSVFPRNDVLVMIDQEGGRVARLKSPFWPEMPTAMSFKDKIETETLSRVKKLINNNYRTCAYELQKLGINVNCAPVLDLFFEHADNIMGDRTFSSDPYEVAELGKEVCKALLEGDVFPVIKHIPGHGRSTCDSHKELPVVKNPLDELAQTDFVPFKELADMPFAMTAHIKYTEIDSEECATNSEKVIYLIRKGIGFKGILFSDDLTMKALKGTMKERAEKALTAGCDAVLHCSGNFDEMEEILESVSYWNKKDRERYRDCWKHLRH